jgi:DNA-binding MarR family transcriptional regulator
MAATAEIDRYIIDVLMRDLVAHDHRPSAFLVYLSLAARGPVPQPALSHAELSERTGLSRRAVQDALRHLERRGLVRRERSGPTETSKILVLRPWKRPSSD